MGEQVRRVAAGVSGIRTSCAIEGQRSPGKRAAAGARRFRAFAYARATRADRRLSPAASGAVGGGPAVSRREDRRTGRAQAKLAPDSVAGRRPGEMCASLDREIGVAQDEQRGQRPDQAADFFPLPRRHLHQRVSEQSQAQPGGNAVGERGSQNCQEGGKGFAELPPLNLRYRLGSSRCLAYSSLTRIQPPTTLWRC